VKGALQNYYKDAATVKDLPVAGERRTDNDEFVHFTGSDTILGPLIEDPMRYPADRFRILSQHSHILQ
jgi:hypothetical protein